MAETVTTTAEEKVLPGKFKEYYNMALNMLKGDSGYKEQSQAQMKYDIGNALRPAYEKARQNRIMQTGRNAAMIDTDAASRGMGSSSWVTDAKNRLRSQEAQDLANIDSDYAGSLYNALLQRMDNQYGQRQALMNSALGLTQSMYDKWKSEDTAATAGGSSGGSGSSRRRSSGSGGNNNDGLGGFGDGVGSNGDDENWVKIGNAYYTPKAASEYLSTKPNLNAPSGRDIVNAYLQKKTPTGSTKKVQQTK